jgi:hypothetical protein
MPGKKVEKYFIVASKVGANRNKKLAPKPIQFRFYPVQSFPQEETGP